MLGGLGAGSISSWWLRALVLPLIILAWLAVLVLSVWVLSHLTRTILLIALASVLAFALTPLANFFGRWAPRSLAIGLAYLVGAGIVLGFGAYTVAVAVGQVSSLITNLPTYGQQAQALEPQVESLLVPVGVQPGWLADLQRQVLGQLQEIATAVARDLIPRLAEFFGTVIDLVLVLILSVYLCANGPSIGLYLQSASPGPRERAQARAMVAIVNRVVGGYVRGVLTLAVLIGVLVGVGLSVLGVPYAVLLGLLAFFMEFVPVLGVFISGAAALLLALVAFHEVTRPLLVLAYFLVVHVIEGDIVGPRIMGRAVGIHPATGLIALVAGTEVFGIWGALFAAPLAGLLQSIATAAWIELRTARLNESIELPNAEAA
jgi:predicted PurR-regulated permease PerM